MVLQILRICGESLGHFDHFLQLWCDKGAALPTTRRRAASDIWRELCRGFGIWDSHDCGREPTLRSEDEAGHGAEQGVHGGGSAVTSAKEGWRSGNVQGTGRQRARGLARGDPAPPI